MANTLRKVALQVSIPVVALVIAANAYIVTKNLKRVEETTSHRLQAAWVQADIHNVLVDMEEMESGQRGYLLTGDEAYLRPYADAAARLPAHFSTLRSRLASTSGQGRSLEAQIEDAAKLKLAEMEETIRFRERGYRHRAFMLVDSNRGKDLMDKVRAGLSALSSAQNNDVARHDVELKESVRRTYKQSAVVTSVLLFVAVIALFGFNAYSTHLELRCAQSSAQLRAASAKQERLTAMMSHDFRFLLAQSRNDVNTLLERYAGFLPRQGQDLARCIDQRAEQMDGVLDELLGEAQPVGMAPEQVETHPGIELTA